MAEATKTTTDITRFQHLLLWPMLLRGPGEAIDQKVEPFVEALQAAGWTTVDDPKLDYAEFLYFHPFVRDFLLGEAGGDPTKPTLRRFHREDITGARLALPGEEPIRLAVKRVEVLLIRPLVLVLVIELSNEDAQGQRVPLTLDRVLCLQNSIRRAYPAYFDDKGQPGDALASFEWEGTGLPSQGPHGLGAPESEFREWVRRHKEPPLYAHWRVLFGDRLRPLGEGKGGLSLKQIIDDRIPAMSYLQAGNLSQVSQDDLDRLPAFDPPGLTYSDEFREAARRVSVYGRFSHWGTTYHSNGTSFALLCGTGTPDYLLDHFRRHYADMGMIAHYQHAALLYFEDAMAALARDLSNRSTEEEFSDPVWRQKVRNLLQRFLKFRTRSYFTEVSNQVQGRELFTLWIERLGTPALFRSVAETADRIYQTLEDHEAKELAKAQTSLARTAEYGIGLSLFLAGAATVLSVIQLSPPPEGVFDGRIGAAVAVGVFAWVLFVVMKRNIFGGGAKKG